MSVEALISTQVIDTTSVGRSVMTAADAAAARTAIGAGTGSGDVVAANNLSDLASAATARTNLGLGTLATQSGTFSGTSSGTNTGDQTTVSGNAGSATVLQTARTINGVSFDGSANITVTAAGSTLSDTVTVAKGGTGLTALGTALQVLRVNAGATALEYAAAGGGIGGATGATDNSVLRADGTGGATLQNSAFVIADNATASPNNTVNHASIQATGGTTNVSVSIVPKGTGAFCLQVPDSGTGGGNVRGANAIDLQTLRSNANQVASGGGCIVIGSYNRASGTDAVAIGISCISTGTRSVAIGNQCTSSGIGSFATGSNSTCSSSERGLAAGYYVSVSGFYGAAGFGNGTSVTGTSAFGSGNGGSATLHCERVHAAGTFAATGDAQSVFLVLRIKTTNATPTTMMLDGASARLTITTGTVLAFTARITGIKSDGTAVAHYVRKGTVKRISNTTSLVGSVETIGTDIEDNASTDVAITADDTNEALQINVTGIASETWRWVAVVEGLEIAYGT
jgi:hypothetical protein